MDYLDKYLIYDGYGNYNGYALKRLRQMRRLRWQRHNKFKNIINEYILSELIFDELKKERKNVTKQMLVIYNNQNEQLCE